MRLHGWICTSMCAVGLTLSTVSVAVPIDAGISGSIYGTVGRRMSIDPLLLYAVSLTESAYGESRTTVKPNAYAIRTPDGPIYPETLNEAKLALNKAILRYGPKALDVGLMQINGQHWHRMDKPLYALFNPTYNVTFGASILQDAMRSTSNPQLAIGHYHSYTPWRARNYGAKVISVYKNLKKSGIN